MVLSRLQYPDSRTSSRTEMSYTVKACRPCSTSDCKETKLLLYKHELPLSCALYSLVRRYLHLSCFLKKMPQDVLTWYWKWVKEKVQEAMLRSLMEHELH